MDYTVKERRQPLQSSLVPGLRCSGAPAGVGWGVVWCGVVPAVPDQDELGGGHALLPSLGPREQVRAGTAGGSWCRLAQAGTGLHRLVQANGDVGVLEPLTCTTSVV